MTNALTKFAAYCDELAPVTGPFLEKAAEICYAIARARDNHLLLSASDEKTTTK